MATRAQYIPAVSSNEVRILRGNVFFVSDEYGDVNDPAHAGLFFGDTRYLSTLTLTLNSSKPTMITSREVDYFSAAFFLSNKKTENIEENTISVIRKRVIDQTFHEEICIDNHNNQAVQLSLKLKFDVDFADLFEVRSQKKEMKRIYKYEVAADSKKMTYTYENKGVYRQTRIFFSKAGHIKDGEVTYLIDLNAKEQWFLFIHFELQNEDHSCLSKAVDNVFDLSKSEMEESIKDWGAKVPELNCDWDILNHVYKRSCMDLAALRLQAPDFAKYQPVVAAGLPWYMTLFGRDTLIASYQCLIVSPILAKNTLCSLAERQGNKIDDFNDEQPGKILHELRRGELTYLKEEPYYPYYGTVDATILFLILFSEVYRWTADLEYINSLKEPALKALQWIEEWGDLDGDGYVEYKTKSEKGIRNQGWKDSGDGIVLANGNVAEPPIALCEVQGYVYDAWLRMAEIAEVWQDNKLADSLIQKANKLKENFNKDFWMEKKGFFAVGLDADKKFIDSKASNMGQLLWTGIVDKDKAGSIANKLMDEDLYSGWGIRTLARSEAGFNPLKYHRGTIWAHDNSIIAAGLSKYGFHEYTCRITNDLLNAAKNFNNKLPEAFAGYSRGRCSFPVRYPSSCSPQAWSSGAPLLLLRTMLGLEPDVNNRTLKMAPYLPESVTKLEIKGVSAYGKKFDIKINGGKHLIEAK